MDLLGQYGELGGYQSRRGRVRRLSEHDLTVTKKGGLGQSLGQSVGCHVCRGAGEKGNNSVGNVVS